MMAIISDSNAETRARVHFHKLSATFPFKFYWFLPVFDFLTLADQEQEVTTHLFLDAFKKKSHRARSGLRDGHENTANHTMRQSPNFCFKHWMAELLCRVALPHWNQVCFRTTRCTCVFNYSGKKVFNISSYHPKLTPTVHRFLFSKKRSNGAVLWNGAPYCNPFRMQWFFKR